ncbi:MAG: hormogonium polysaccharide biosynthesis glycosyltransferase HpsE [Scytolyngbya sp. HA4215-MV1]|nr:hormogonium polysaccharide biosynthesis glycosyltransferase HpsE [Scytolyngbya sp. HA4215-MV1]
MDFTVAICTYNGAKRLPEVLEGLRSQTGTENIAWEVIIVDNNSTDDTRQVIQSYQSQWLADCPLRYAFEPEQGAAYARLRAAKEAHGSLIGFLDDDTVPTNHWITAACAFAQVHPQAGAYGSQIHGDFEVEPSEELKQVAFFLAVIERGDEPFLYERKKRILPPSAGLVVRRHAWCESVPNRPFLTGRTAKSMLTSEDLEALVYIQNAGWQIWYNPAMEIHHKIPHWRMEREYLLSLVRGIGLARHHIRMIRLTPWLRPLMFPLYWVNDVRKAMVHFLRYREQLERNLPAACEMEFLWSTLLSPFYLCGKYFSQALVPPTPSEPTSENLAI